MAEPAPLIQTPAAKLDWSRPRTPVASEFGDIYFSTDGGLAETRTVFLEGCGLPEGWSDHPVFTIAELGFGSGLNFLATWQSWAETAAPKQRLHFISFEKFPLDTAQLKRALQAWPDLKAFSTQLIDKWPGRVKGIHRINFDAVTLTLVHDDVSKGLNQISGLKANAWFLDGFSPAQNPEMWSAGVMRHIAQCSAAGAKLASFSVAGAVRTALQDVGFTVEKRPGFGRKRHRLEARFQGSKTGKDGGIEKALIVGAGIAGQSLAWELSARHIPFDLIDDRSHPHASGNPAALVKPRFDLQDRPESRFFLAAYLHALQRYSDDVILSRGIRQLPKTEKETERFQKLANQAPLGEIHMTWDNTALWLAQALVINPKLFCEKFGARTETFEKGTARSEYSHVFLAAGYGIKALAPTSGFRFSRGQLSWAKPVWDTPTAYGGYALNVEGAALVGATHDRIDTPDPFEIRSVDDERNLANLAEVSGQVISPFARASRASVRVTTRDTLPIFLNLGAEHWALSGLGSRGFTFAPLLADALVSQLNNEVGPLDKALLSRLSDPARLA